MKTINLETAVISENRKVLASEEATLNEQAKLDAEVDKVLETADRTYHNGIMSELGFDYKLAAAEAIHKVRTEFSMLSQDRIMDVAAIKKTCMEYSLRFLPTRLYKGALDSGIGAKLDEFKAKLGGALPISGAAEMVQDGAGLAMQEGKPQFYIAAPAESFALQPVPRDPLLFCRLNATKFFLLHKWGNDLDAKEVEKRKGQVTDRNWNSSRLEVDRADYARMIADRSLAGSLNAQWSNAQQSALTQTLWGIGSLGSSTSNSFSAIVD